MYYDTVHCSYDLGPGFWNHNLHTKELSQTCGCYWISPAGELFEVDYTGTQVFTDNERMPYAPSGTHGRVTPVDISTTIRYNLPSGTLTMLNVPFVMLYYIMARLQVTQFHD